MGWAGRGGRIVTVSMTTRRARGGRLPTSCDVAGMGLSIQSDGTRKRDSTEEQGLDRLTSGE